MKTKILLIFLFPIICSAAGGTVVRNGGGFGEMTAVTVFYKMDKYLRPCLKSPEICNLSAVEAQVLNDVVDSLNEEYKSFELSFFTDPVTEDIITEAFIGSPISLRSGALADQNGKPYTFSYIASLVLQGLLTHQQYSDLNLARKVFENMKSRILTSYLNENQIHWVNIQFRDRTSFDEIILEQKEFSYDLSPYLASAQLCSEDKILNIKMQRFTLPNPGAHSVVMDVLWNCGGNNFGKAKLELFIGYKENGDFDPSKTSAKAYGVIKP